MDIGSGNNIINNIMAENKYNAKYIREEDGACLFSDEGLSRDAAIECFVDASEVLNLLEYRWDRDGEDYLI